jgi:hypothetical protein
MFFQRGDTLFQSTKKLKGSTMKPNLQRRDQFIDRLRGPISRDVMDELNKRNQVRVKKIIADMSDKWIGHPNHKIKVTKREETTT